MAAITGKAESDGAESDETPHAVFPWQTPRGQGGKSAKVPVLTADRFSLPAAG